MTEGRRTRPLVCRCVPALTTAKARNEEKDNENHSRKHGEQTSGKALAGVIGSLVQKGYVASWGKGRDSAVEVTKEGWEAYQAWAEQNLSE